MELDLPASISSFFKYLFCLQGRVGMRGERNLLSAGSFPQCLQWAEMGQATATEWRYFRVSHVSVGAQAPGPYSVAFSKLFAGSCIGSGATGTSCKALSI